jgi:hypothetical protein
MHRDDEAEFTGTDFDKRTDVAALMAEVEALRNDAQRYRYLRNRQPRDVLQTTGDAAGCWIDCEIGETLTLLTGDDADAAIDAAMVVAPAVGAETGRNEATFGARDMSEQTEREKLRAAQAEAVMPLIGPLLDAWECCAQSVREEHPDLDKQLRKINRAMEDAGESA